MSNNPRELMSRPMDEGRNVAWFIDKAVQLLVFLGGVSAIIFIIGIFVFITKEGMGFIVETMNFKEFLLSPRWRPTSEWKTTYGAFAMIVGTASVTGLAMVVAIPFSLGSAIFIGCLLYTSPSPRD